MRADRPRCASHKSIVRCGGAGGLNQFMLVHMQGRAVLAAMHARPGTTSGRMQTWMWMWMRIDAVEERGENYVPCETSLSDGCR